VIEYTFLDSLFSCNSDLICSITIEMDLSGKSFQISRDHLKTEKQGSSGKRSSSGKSSDNPQNKAARAYVRNMPGSRRGAFLDLLGGSPENKRKKTDSSKSDKDSSSARKKSGHASVGSYPVAAGVSH
jgi:hypothetical protein